MSPLTVKTILPSEPPGEGKMWAVHVTLKSSVFAAADALAPMAPRDTTGSEAPDTSSRVEETVDLSLAEAFDHVAGHLLTDTPAVVEGPSDDR